ncbi:MAG: hypothetical protein SO253_02610 [Bacilli bacterium]|nr:hypothetical protein [Bacilli bacterium]
MKEYIQKASKTFNKNKGLLLTLSLALGIIFGVSFFVGMISGTIVILLFLILPFIISIYAIAMKLGDNREVVNKDLYFGFKNFLMSLSLATKILVKAVLLGILVWFVISSIGYSMIMIVLENQGHPIFDIINSGDMQAMMEAMYELITTNPMFLVVNYVAILTSLIVSFNIFVKRSFTPFICFETTFTLDSAKKLSKNLKSRGYRLMNNLFLVLYIVLIIILELLSTLLYNINVNFMLMYFIVVVVIFILMTPLFFINVLANYYYYDKNHRENIKKIYKEYLNVAMRTTQSKLIDDELKNNSDNHSNDNKKDE